MSTTQKARLVPLEAFRNRVQHAENMARCAFLATQADDIEPFVRDSIGTVLDRVVCELMGIGEDMEKRLEASPEERLDAD